MARRRAYAGRLRFRRGGLRSLLYGTFRGALFRLLPLGARHGRPAAARGGFLVGRQPLAYVRAVDAFRGPQTDSLPRRRRPHHDRKTDGEKLLDELYVRSCRPRAVYRNLRHAASQGVYDRRPAVSGGPQGRADVRDRTACGRRDPCRSGRGFAESGPFDLGCRFRRETDRRLPRRG